MSYAEARTKLANLLIKAGYDKAKSLRAVRYPYVSSLQLTHNIYYWDDRHKSIRSYQIAEEFHETSETGFAQVGDKEYDMLGEITSVKAVIRITQETVDDWIESYGFGAYWYSYALKANIKYQHGYPRNNIQDSTRSIGNPQFGIAYSAGDYGEQKGYIPLPMGGWEKVELPDVT